MNIKSPFFVSAILCVLVLLTNHAQAQTPDENEVAPMVQAPIKDSLDISVFEKVEVEASVNLAAWRNHLQRKLLPYIEKAAKKMKVGQYTVNVRFLVEKDGSISDVQALNDPGFGLAEAAVTVVKSGPRWSAGEHKGKKVRSYHTQPITFAITAQ